MTELKKTEPSELIQQSEALNRWIDDEKFKLAESIKRQVIASISKHKFALPENLVLELSEEKSPDGRLLGSYIIYNNETQGLSEVTEEYFKSGSKPPVILSTNPLPITAWIKYGTLVNKMSMSHLAQKKD